MKKISKESFFKNYVSNIAIVLMLCVVASVTLNWNAVGVIGTKENEAIYSGNKDSSYISLMINVYWGTEYIDDILDTLNTYDVKCTFFVGGTWAEKEQETLKKIYDNGHEIANHGYFHKDQDKLDYDGNYSEINTNHKLIKSLLNVEMNLFAPPSGAYNNTTLQVASDLGYKTIMWTKDTIDWRDKDADLIYTRATKNIKAGDLILMHPTACTLEALPKILDYYNSVDLIATTVSNTIN